MEIETEMEEIFKCLVAEKLFAQSDASNCKVDNDTIILNIAMLQWQSISKQEKLMLKAPIIDVAMVTVVPSSLPTNNVETYLAGYLLSKIPVDTCQDCSNQLMLPKLPSPYDELSVYEFL